MVSGTDRGPFVVLVRSNREVVIHTPGSVVTWAGNYCEQPPTPTPLPTLTYPHLRCALLSGPVPSILLARSGGGGKGVAEWSIRTLKEQCLWADLPYTLKALVRTCRCLCHGKAKAARQRGE